MKIKTHSQVISWVFNYMLIFFICAVSFFVTFRFFLNLFNEQINATLSVMSGQTKSFYDTEFEKQKLCAYNVLNNNIFEQLPDELAQTSGWSQTKAIKNAVDELGKSFVNIDSVNNCIIMYEGFDGAISFDGYQSKKVVFEHYFKNNYSDYSNWSEEFFNFEGNSEYLSQTSEAGRQIVSLYKTDSKYGSTVAIMLINADAIVDSGADGTENETLFYILSYDGELLYSNNSKEINLKNEYQGTFKVDGTSYYAAMSDSDNGILKYIIMISETPYRLKFKIIVSVLVGAGVLCLLLCLFFAFYLSKKAYKPIDRILRRIGAEYTREERELSFIEKKFDKVMEQNYKMRRQLDITDDRFRETFLANLIKSQSELTANEIYEKYDIDLRTGDLIVVLFDIYEKGVFPQKEVESINFTIKNIFSELMEAVAKCHFLYIEKRYCCIINLNNMAPYNDIYENLEFLSAFVIENFAMGIKCAVSKKGAVASLPELYAQSQKLLELENVEWRILIYDEILDYMTDEFSNESIKQPKSAQRAERIERIYKYVNEHFSNPLINMSYLAEEFDITINHLSRSFKERYGIRPSEYLLKCRLEKGISLLTRTELSVAEIGEQCGFLNTAMFIRSFKKAYGSSPGIYRDMNRQKSSDTKK